MLNSASSTFVNLTIQDSFGSAEFKTVGSSSAFLLYSTTSPANGELTSNTVFDASKRKITSSFSNFSFFENSTNPTVPTSSCNSAVGPIMYRLSSYIELFN